MPKLLISLQPGHVLSKDLVGDAITIGRAPENVVQIDHHTVSACHAVLALSEGHYKIKDLGSTNHTCVNGTPVREAELKASCNLRIGSVECIYKTENNEPVTPAGTSMEQMQSKLAALQRQTENLMKARDLIHQQNSALVKERNDARLDADTNSDRLKDAEKQIEALSKERDELLKSNTALKAEVKTLTAKLAGLQPAEIPTPEEEEEIEEEELVLAQSGGKTASAGAAKGGIFGGAPLLGSWLNRGAKRGTVSPAQAGQTTRITLPPVALPKTNGIAPPALKPAAAVAPVPAPALEKRNADSVAPATIIGRVPANAAPRNPDIKPAWELLNNLRRTLHYFLRHMDELKALAEMAETMHRLTELAQSELLRPIQSLAIALETLMADLHASPANINPSVLRTIGQCIDFIATLIHESNLNKIRDMTSAKIFAIDDDEGILEVIKATMEMVHVNITTAAQSSAGLTALSGQNYDLILLDVGLPEMNGMDICSRVRAMPHHQKTPIVFLTGEATVQNRVKSTLNGGNDLIGKPFSVPELTVKVIVWIFKGQLGMV